MNKLNAFLLSILTVISLLISGCDEEWSPDKQAKEDEKKILKYIEENDLDAERHSSGLYFVVLQEGSGNNPTENSHVQLNFLVSFLDGEIINQGDGAIIYLANEIEGLQIGIPFFKRGGKGILLIPSALGYGGYYHPVYDINKVLVYDFELLDFQ